LMLLSFAQAGFSFFASPRKAKLCGAQQTPKRLPGKEKATALLPLDYEPVERSVWPFRVQTQTDWFCRLYFSLL